MPEDSRDAPKGFERRDGAAVDETEVIAQLMAHRQGPSHVMIDVGAHFGKTASYFDALGWTVVCFEPDPNNRAKLEERYLGNPRVRIDPRAVSDSPQVATNFYTSSESTGISGLQPFTQNHTLDSQVTVTTLRIALQEHSIAHIDFLKIDAESVDFAVLKGMSWDLILPDVVDCEFEDQRSESLGYTHRELAEYLTQLGYSVYVSEWHPVLRYGIRHDWRRVFPFLQHNPAKDSWGNLLAFRDDPGLEKVHTAFLKTVSMQPKSS